MMPFPSQPPLTGDPRPWSFPRTVIRDLPNGLRVAAVQTGSLPIAQVRWVFGSGRIHETRNRLGSGLLLQRAMRHGTEQLEMGAFAETLDRLGARMGGGVTIDSSIVSISGVSQHLWRFVDLATDVALKPALPDIAVAAERYKAMQIHHHEWDQVETIAAMWLARSLYGDHPYGLPRTTTAGLKQTSVADLAALHRSIVDPHRGLVLVVGKVDPDAIVQRLSDRYGDLPSNTTPVPIIPAAPQSHRGTMVMIAHETAETTTVGFGLPAIARNHPDYTALRVVNQVFGGSASARLFESLRNQQGLCYGAYSTLDCGKYAGDITATVSLAPDRASDGFSALHDQLRSAATGQFEAAEIDHAKRFLVGSFPQRASGLAGLAMLATAAWLHELPDDVWSSEQARVNGIDIQQASACARQWLVPDQATWVAVGRPKSLEAVAAKAMRRGLEISHQTMDDLENDCI